MHCNNNILILVNDVTSFLIGITERQWIIINNHKYSMSEKILLFSI